MTLTADQLYEAAMVLPEQERAKLTERLLDTLPQTMPSQLHPAWRDELRRRLAQVDSGEVTPMAWEKVKQAVAEPSRSAQQS